MRVCALAFSIHMSLLGGEGLSPLAAVNHDRARQTAERLAQIPA
jgi:glycine dehydrogenase subunit 1